MVRHKAYSMDVFNSWKVDSSLNLPSRGDRPTHSSGIRPKLSPKALSALEQMGVTVKLNNPVSAVRQDGVMVGTN